MSLFGWFKNKKIEDEEVEEADTWEAEEENDVVATIFDSICEKCELGERIDKLSKVERVLYVTQILEQEVNNGGFDQFFYNSSGDFANEIVSAFTEIGAHNTARICEKALTAFGGREIPSDRSQRQDLMEELEGDKFERIMEQCDDKFYEYTDDLAKLNYEYVMSHKDEFGIGE